MDLPRDDMGLRITLNSIHDSIVSSEYDTVMSSALRNAHESPFSKAAMLLECKFPLCYP